MASDVDAGNGHERSQEPRVHSRRLYAARVEIEGGKADRDMEHLARDLVAMDEGAPVLVDRDEA